MLFMDLGVNLFLVVMISVLVLWVAKATRHDL